MSPFEECVRILPSHTPHLSLSKPHQPIYEHDEEHFASDLLRVCGEVLFVLKPFPAPHLGIAIENSIH